MKNLKEKVILGIKIALPSIYLAWVAWMIIGSSLFKILLWLLIGAVFVLLILFTDDDGGNKRP